MTNLKINTGIIHFLFYLFLFIPVWSAHAQCTGAGMSLTHSFAANNGSKGVMFNITATNTVTIYCIDGNLYVGTAPYEIYYRPSTYVGNEANSAGWTLLGTANITSNGSNVPTPIPIPINVVIPAGSTYGFYVTTTVTTGGVNYWTSGSALTFETDANISFYGGVGKTYPFGLSYNNRLFSGTVHYGLGNTLPVELVDFEATNLDREVVLNWKTESENNNDFFSVDRSTNGDDWITIGTVPSKGSSTGLQSYQLIDEQPLSGISYYRLRQTDNDGTETKYEIIAVKRDSEEDGKLMVSPNPATDFITVMGTEAEVELFDLTGRNLTKELSIVKIDNALLIDISKLEQDIIIVQSGEQYSLVIKE